MSNNVVPAIERLKGRENYDNWKFAVQAYFECDGLWTCIDGDEKDNEKLVKAKGKLILLIDPINFVHIRSSKTAKEIWIALQKAFEDNGLSRKVGLRTLTSTKLLESQSVEDYVNKIVLTAHKLRDIGMNVTDEWVGTLLLSGRPDHYGPMIMGIESSGAQITSDFIKTKLLQDVPSSETNGTGNITRWLCIATNIATAAVAVRMAVAVAEAATAAAAEMAAAVTMVVI